ncbi:CsgE family curli-type amyloid fiber assembly protein [Aequorivita lipolytica]|uniref:Curli production assembly/transport component CsgE n=1 Tax=Aequorivita lipolytica TaxID=153267 RepID=A0A5C6YPB8_9FLAO|nr:CsgE family curli-type amyloid fiber assembly protein [Aequorivita lipolytica]TXD68693.1 hypothetical protein ESV24_11045 [Aequorivita lipolytica]SRX53165.1 hypothetical protein AEQU2_02393 [Aequorivita lipolytica]
MNQVQVHKQKFLKHFAAILILTIGFSANAQFYNKEFVGKIYVKQDSEFFTFTATAENLTPTDVNLKYDFIVYKTDANNNVSKSNQSNLFFLKGNDKIALSNAIINYNEEGKIILVLILYDDDGKPVGQDRIELNSQGGNQEFVNEEMTNQQQEAENSDQAAPQDGVILDGLVLEKTITKAGRDFYKYFYSEYYNRQIRTKKNILIEEVPGRFRNTRISVKIDDQLLWQFFSQPKKSFLQEMATTALDRSISYLQQLQKQKANTLTRY